MLHLCIYILQAQNQLLVILCLTVTKEYLNVIVVNKIYIFNILTAIVLRHEKQHNHKLA